MGNYWCQVLVKRRGEMQSCAETSVVTIDKVHYCERHDPRPAPMDRNQSQILREKLRRAGIVLEK